MDSFAYFPSTVYREEHPEWVDYTLKVCDKYFVEQAKVHESAPLPKCFPVLQTAHMANDPDLKYITDYFAQSSIGILRRQGYAVEKYDFVVSGMWGQNIGCYGGHNPHVHKNSQMTGLFFLNTPEGGSYPVFHDPRPARAMIELDAYPSQEVTEALSQVHFSNMRPGTFMFFNSWLPHQLTLSSTNEPTKFIHLMLSHKEKTQACNM